MTETVTLDGRFNGPPASANGGYTCGVVAGLVGAEAVEVTLRSPPPLGRPLGVVRDGERVELRDGEALVAEGGPAEHLLEVPEPVPADEVAAAEAAGSDAWTAEHPFPTCVVCGPRRGPGDGLRIFPVELPGRDGLFGAPWTPDESLAGDTGAVRPECVWAALDCPTSAPVANYGEGPPMVLARFSARVGCPVRVGEPHTLLSWRLSVEGRKREGGCALYDADGRFVASSRALWIELRSG
ncbi:MAG TPA: hypothetical protein VFB44_00810 [Thermoleophilaceae bacterium]|nr:hypothetical protein [Thermoleophilaceae bacterium]